MKGKKQPNMVLSPERAQMLLRLTDEDAGKVTKALVAYANTRALPEGFSEVLLFCFHTLLDELEQNWEKKRSRSEQNRRNIQKRWNDTTEYDRIPSNTTEYDRIPSNTIEYNRIRSYREKEESQAQPERNPLDYLLTGEDGEPIVIYRSC